MSRTILMVDDSLTVRMDLKDAFDDAGFRSVCCETAAEAREALARETFDAVILDVLLPDGDGTDLLQDVRASASEKALILMLSTEAEIKDRIRGLRTGADEYVGKPYDRAYVVAKVREALRARVVPSSRETTVLVIDDSKTFREILRSGFERSGYTVLTAESGEDGLRVAADHRPDAIVVDGVMPGIDGATVIRRIRLDAALRRIPCLLLTASEDRNAELRALDAGADAFVRKEEDTAVVLAKLAAILRGTATHALAGESSSLLSPKRILAVDDSVTYLHELSSVLLDEGYDVISARSGEEALELLAVQSVDCVLLDLVMPGLGGQEACRRIKSAATMRDIPVVILTSLEGRDAMIEGLSAGADDYLSKSSEFEVLKARIRVQLRRKQYEDENRRFRAEIYRREMEAAEARTAREVAETRAALTGELERKNRELEAFSYSVSHDLRAPLRSISGFSRLLLDHCGDTLDSTAQGYLDNVRTSAHRMGQLIDDLLTLSRLNRAKLRRRQIDVSELAREVAAGLKSSDSNRNVEFSIQDGLFAQADQNLMKIVLENLFGNSWKFTMNVECACIEFGAQAEVDVPTFFVRDNGAGFEMQYANKLFKPFQRLHSESVFPGTGIGLATVFRVIDRHGGKIWAEGIVDQGATFFFTVADTTGVLP